MYVTEMLRIIGENTAKLSQGGYIKARYYDVIYPKPQDKRTGEEIAADIIKRAGLKVIKSKLKTVDSEKDGGDIVESI